MLFVAAVRYIPEGMRLTAAPNIKAPILRQLVKLIFLPLLMVFIEPGNASGLKCKKERTHSITPIEGTTKSPQGM